MFDIEAYYRDAEQGDVKNKEEILEYIKNYKNVICWGASYLGTAIGKYLQDNGVLIKEYWDARADEIKTCNGINVKMPFEEVYQPQDTLIMLCIGNTAIFDNLIAKLKQEKYTNYIRGDKFYMGNVCGMSANQPIDGLICNGTMICRSMFCSKLHNIVKQRNDKGGVFLPNITFMITSYCSLKCKYCVAYMNSYENSRREHVPYEQISKDIDAIFDNVDAVGSVTIQGGEPFLHPDIEKIVEKILQKRNVGIISIATNGIYKIEKEKLKSFRDNRLNVAFSGYYDALPQEKLDVYYQNIETMTEMHVPHTVGVKMPEWQIPPSLWDKGYDEETKALKKRNCRIPERCLQVMNGRLYPCIYGLSLHKTGVAEYPSDYIELEGDNIQEKIKAFMEQPYYNSCGHCGSDPGMPTKTNMAGEQGFYDFINKKGAI